MKCLHTCYSTRVCCSRSVCLHARVCVCVCLGSAEEAKHWDGSCQLPLWEMTETGAVKSALYTRSLSLWHMVTHGRMPTPTQHTRSVCQTGSLSAVIYFPAWERSGCRTNVAPVYVLESHGVSRVERWLSLFNMKSVCLKEVKGPLCGGQCLRGCLPSKDP